MEIIRRESINNAVVEAVTDGNRVAVFLIEEGESKQVCDWIEDIDAAAFIFNFTVSMIKIRDEK